MIRKPIILASALAVTVSSIVGAKAYADTRTWPCEVILCMANPGGPTSATQCIKPLRKMFTHFLTPWAGFPACQGSSADVDVKRKRFSWKVKSIEFDMPETGLYEVSFNDDFKSSIGVDDGGFVVTPIPGVDPEPDPETPGGPGGGRPGEGPIIQRR